MRRDFDLPEVDREFLDTRGRLWETIVSTVGGSTKRWLLIHDFDVPPGYNCRQVSAALLIEAAYPDTQIDMVYFLPALNLVSGGNINNLSSEDIDGQTFQRWSRHRTNANPWRPDVDCVATHLLQVDEWLKRELGK